MFLDGTESVVNNEIFVKIKSNGDNKMECVLRYRNLCNRKRFHDSCLEPFFSLFR